MRFVSGRYCMGAGSHFLRFVAVSGKDQRQKTKEKEDRKSAISK
jgi:hypothetical protein